MVEFYNSSSNEDLAVKNAQSTKKRVKLLAGVLLIALVAKVFIKKPAPPPPPDHSNVQVKYVPGALENISPEHRAKMDPQLLAKLEEANKVPQEYIPSKPQKEFLPKMPETVIARLPESPQLSDSELLEKFKYGRIKKSQPQKSRFIQIDTTKKVLVLLRGSRHIKVREAERTRNSVDIIFDKSIHAKLPRRIVRSISNNALTWKEPVPKGFVRVKPAKGISMTVQKHMAKRITLKKKDEES